MFRTRFFLLPLIALYSSTSWGWGAKGHRIVSSVGGNITQQGQEFWQANLDNLRQLSTVPDRVWKSASTKSGEAPNHWFQADAYYSDDNLDGILQFPVSYDKAVEQYTQSVILTNGTAPWRIRQLYGMALNALRSGDEVSAMELIGAMSHYIGDLSQPLHVSKNYDGQETGQKGIHKFFETDVIENEDAIAKEVETKARQLLKDSSIRKEGTLMQIILEEVDRSVKERDLILNTDNDLGRGKEGRAAQRKIAIERMADGAATFAIILARLWKEAGVELHASPLPIHDPDWIEPRFSEIPDRKDLTSMAFGDDCALQ